MTLQYEPWRRATDEERHEFIQGAINELTQRWDFGDRKYESSRLGFRGDPVRHGLEEVLDLLFYNFYTSRMVAALEAENKQLRDRIAELEATT